MRERSSFLPRRGPPRRAAPLRARREGRQAEHPRRHLVAPDGAGWSPFGGWLATAPDGSCSTGTSALPVPRDDRRAPPSTPRSSRDATPNNRIKLRADITSAVKRAFRRRAYGCSHLDSPTSKPAALFFSCPGSDRQLMFELSAEAACRAYGRPIELGTRALSVRKLRRSPRTFRNSSRC